MKLWVLAIYENETDEQPAKKGYAIADTLEEIVDRASKEVPGDYKCITIDISDVSTYDPGAFPPDGIIWSQFV